MNNIIKIVLAGKPKAKQRARVGKYKQIYNPQSLEMSMTKMEIKKQLPEGFIPIPKGKPVIINWCAFFLPAKTESTKKFLEKIKNEDVFYIKKNDRDNVDKYILDCFSKVIITDDNQVAGGTIFKYYTPDNPRIEIEVKW